MGKDQRPNWRKALLLLSVSILSSFIVNSLIGYLYAITHNRIFLWLGFIAFTVILLSGITVSNRIMRRQEKAREKEQQATI